MTKLVSVAFADVDGLPTKVTAANPLPVTGGGGGGGDATADKQDDQTDLLTSIDATLAETVTALPHQPLDVTSDLICCTSTQAGAGNELVLAGTSGETIRCHEFSISVSAACTVQFYSDDPASGGTLLSRAWVFQSAGLLEKHFRERPYYKTAIDKGLYYKVTGAANVDVNADCVKSA